MQEHAAFMRRCFQLAEYGRGRVEPNPVVGSVVVCNNEIVSEGWHQAFGGPHAEVHAIQCIPDAISKENCTLYVNLEPCSHHGKTPPCADLIIRSGFKKVVVAMRDPNPIVAGKGLERLRNAGVEIVEDVLRNEALALNRPFITFHLYKRPMVVLKWAQTADGYIGRQGQRNIWISGPEARTMVHLWRNRLMAILVGRKTIETDDPQLTARLVNGRQPVRIVLGCPEKREIPYRVMDQSSRTWVFPEVSPALASVANQNPKDLIGDMLKRAFSENIQSILVEGGSDTLNRFLQKGVWDEARVFVSPERWGDGIPAPLMDVQHDHIEQVGKDQLLIYRNQAVKAG